MTPLGPFDLVRIGWKRDRFFMSLGSISSFTLQDRAGYSCYLRVAYCSSDKAGATKITMSDRLGRCSSMTMRL
jgi:hypothetical protein